MMLRTGSVVIVSMVSACATAIPREGAGDGPDAAVAADAPALAAPDAGPPAGCAFAGVLATWSFTGQPGTEASIAAASAAPGVSASHLTRAPSLSATSGSGSINASGWPTTAQPGATKYYTLSLAPPAGCTLEITSIALDAQASGTGPAKASLATSADGFAHAAPLSTSAPTTAMISASSAGAALEVRIYGFAATGAAGTLRLQDVLTVNGSLH